MHLAADINNLLFSMLDPKTGLLINEEPENHPGASGNSSKKRTWQDTDKQEWLRFYQEYMKDRSKQQPQHLNLREYKDFNVGRDGFRNYDKTDDTIYLDLTDSEDEEADQNPDIDGEADIVRDKDVEWLTEDFNDHGRKKAISKKVKRENLRHNSLTLLKYSNICLFKWARHCFQCFECLETFKDMQMLRNHVADSHTHEDITAKILKEKHTLHKVDISGLECAMCSEMLSSLEELEIHLIEHDISLKPGGSTLIPFKQRTDRFICQLCEDEFATNFGLHRHMDRHYLTYRCPECKIGFSNRRALKVHWETHRKDKIACTPKRKTIFKRQAEDSKKRFKCSHCGQKFRYDYKRAKHIIEEHKEQGKLFQCEFCPKIFMTVHWLTKHKNCVHQDKLYS